MNPRRDTPLEEPRGFPLNEVRFSGPGHPETELEALSLAAIYRRRKTYSLRDPQRIHFNLVVLVESGRGEHMIDFRRHAVGPGSLLLVRPGQVQAFLGVNKVQGPVLAYTDDFADSVRGDSKGFSAVYARLRRLGPSTRLSPRSFRALRAAMRGLGRSLDQKSAFPAQSFRAEFQRFVIALCGLGEFHPGAADGGGEDPTTARFEVLLERSFAAHRSTRHYAQALGMSVRTLDRHLARTRNATCRRLVWRRVVLEAKRQLTRQDLPVKNVADSLGFSETSNFNRFFKRATGMTPGRFRRSLRPPPARLC